MTKKPSRSPESIEQRREYARQRSRRRYRDEKAKVLEEITKYKQGDTFANGADRRKEYHRKYIQDLRETRRKWFREYKSKLCCEICGFSHPAALDFHHKKPSDKEDNVSHMLHKLVNIDTILSEIEKCAVLCANCHRILHDEESE